MDCNEVKAYRSRLEQARDRRAGNLHVPEVMSAFDDAHREFVEARKQHREETGCEEFH